MPDLLPGTEVTARGLRWELVYTQNPGVQNLHRLRGLEGAFAGQELDLLGPFDDITPSPTPGVRKNRHSSSITL